MNNNDFIKYPLPIDKSTVNWNKGYMLDGGNQLVEIMEKEFPLEWIKSNQKRLKISDLNMRKLELWIEFNLVVGSVMGPLGLRSAAASKNFFYKGDGILRKLLREVDLTPIWDNDKFVSKYSFVEYDEIGDKDGKLLISKFSKKWITKEHKEIDKQIVSKYFFVKFVDGQWLPLDPKSEVAEKLKMGYEVMKKLVS